MWKAARTPDFETSKLHPSDKRLLYTISLTKIAIYRPVCELVAFELTPKGIYYLIMKKPRKNTLRCLFRFMC